MPRRDSWNTLVGVRDEVFSLEPSCDKLRPELRGAFRAGFSQARRRAAGLLTTAIIEEEKRE